MIQSKNQEILLQTLQSLLENSPDLIFIKDKDLNYIDASTVFANIVGVEDRKNLLGKTDFDLFDIDLARKYTIDDKAVLNSGRSILNNIEPLPDRDGKKKYSSTSKFLLKDSNNEIIGIYGIGRDATMQMALEEEKESSRMTRQVFEDILEADITKDKMLSVEGSVWSKNLSLAKTTTFSKTFREIAEKFIHKDYKDEFLKIYSRDKLIAEFNRGNSEFTHITSYSDDKTEYKWKEIKARLYYSKVSKTLRLLVYVKDLDDEIKDKVELRHKAETDALTGLLNRENVIEQIQKCLTGYGINERHALLFIDLDYFKEVNDQLGHLFGDKVIKKIAEKLKKLFGKNDIVGRIGGDEFLVLIKNVGTKQEIEAKVQDILEVIPFYLYQDDIEIYVTCCIGVSLYYSKGKTIETMYEEADKAMYQAKEKGRNRLSFFEK